MKIKLAENIRKFRKEHSFTQEQLAEAMGVTVGAVYKWENGLSTPEIKLIMELADMFEVSVDVLLGYEQQNENVENRLAKIEQCIREKNFEEGVVEAEKALKKYPNHFEIVYMCGLLYQLKFVEEKEVHAIERSNMLLQRAITLLYQNEDKRVDKITILNMIAQNYLLIEKTEQALESLKQNNVCGINNSLIGVIYAQTMKQSGEAKVYLTESLGDCIGNLIRTIVGFGYMYMEEKDRKKGLEALRWLEGLLDSMKYETPQIAFTDQIKAVIWAQSALWEVEGKHFDGTKSEHFERAEILLQKAYSLAMQFDEAPVYNMEGIKFLEEAEGAVAYIEIGSTAMEAVEYILYKEAVESEAYEFAHNVWKNLKEKERKNE